MNYINGTGAYELADLELVDLESCFDPLFYPPEEFLHYISDTFLQGGELIVTSEESYAKMMPCTTVLSADPDTKRDANMDQPKLTILWGNFGRAISLQAAKITNGLDCFARR